MTKFTNFLACLVAAFVCYRLAEGQIDQHVVKSAYEAWFYWPCAWFSVFALLNLRS